MKYLKSQLFLFFVVITLTTNAQTIASKIVDEDTQQPIPYVTIQYGEHKGAISNEEGDFSILFDQDFTTQDSLHLSSVGYASKSIALKDFNMPIISMKEEALELSTVFLTDKKLPPEVIIEKVQENLEKNYTHAETKNRFFMRETFKQYYKKMDFGFKKSSIKEINKELIDSIVKTIPKSTSFYNETLGDFYNNNGSHKKLNIIKSSKLINKNQVVSFESLQKRFMQIINDNVKRDSYLKIKSGWFGTKVEVDSIVEGAKTIKEKQKQNDNDYYFDNSKGALFNLVNNLFYQEDSEINVIHKSSKYEFVLEDYVDFQDALAYVVSFKPKRSADFSGKLYINTEDFAILRIDYQNVDKVYDKIFNMFGINLNHLIYKGTMIFGKNKNNTYSLKYVNHENVRSFQLDRPLTIIEKNKNVKGRRKQNELKLELKLNLIDRNKKEIVVFNTDLINESEYSSYKENKKVDVKYFSTYNPDYWKGYNIIEPNQAIKEYTSVTE